MTKSPLNPEVIWFSVCTDGCWLTGGRSDGTSRLARAETRGIRKHRFTGWIAIWRSMSYSVVKSNTAQRWGFPAGGLLGITSLWLPAWCKDVACYGYLGVTPNNSTGRFIENSSRRRAALPRHIPRGSWQCLTSPQLPVRLAVLLLKAISRRPKWSYFSAQKEEGSIAGLLLQN